MGVVSAHAPIHYLVTHEWIKRIDNDVYQIGISEHAQYLLGDIVFVDLASVGVSVKAEVACMRVETAKSVIDVHSPVTGVICAVNDNLLTDPQLINREPEQGGWLFCVRANPEKLISGLLSSDEYQALLDA